MILGSCLFFLFLSFFLFFLVASQDFWLCLPLTIQCYGAKKLDELTLDPNLQIHVEHIYFVEVKLRSSACAKFYGPGARYQGPGNKCESIESARRTRKGLMDHIAKPGNISISIVV